MDHIFTCKIRNSCRTPQGPKSRLEEQDPNDTIDCFTLPEIDIPHEQSCCYTQLPGAVHRIRGEQSERSSLLDARDANTCNILSPEVPKLLNESVIPDVSEKQDECLTQNTAIFVNDSDEKSKEAGKLNATKRNSNFDASRLNLPNARTAQADFDLSDQVYASAKDNLDSSNAIKPPTSKGEIRTRSVSPYAKHVSDPPRSRPVCLRSKQTPMSVASTDNNIDEDDVPKSVVYITRSPGTVYQLEFYTKNVVLSPLYVDERFALQPENDKKVQPPYYEYRDQTSKFEPSMCFVRQKFAVSMDENRHKPYKYILPPLRVYTDEASPVRKRSASEASKATSNGSIYFLYKGIMLRVRCTQMPISQIKMPVSEDILARMAKLNMPSSESLKNKGVIVGRCGFDVLQFTFDMDRISLSRLEMKGTAAVQTEDKMVYIREKSRITGRSLLLALPESTYFYRDPMASIHRLHMNFQGTNVMPLWKYEMMKARLAERRGVTETEAKIDRAFKQTRGSRLYFEGLDSLITVQGGLMCCEVPFGQDKYETMMLNEYQGNSHHRRKMPQYTIKKWKPNNSGKGQSFDDRPDTVVSTQMENVRSPISDERQQTVEENSSA